MSEPAAHKDGQVEPLERETLLAALQAREQFLSGILGSLESFVTVDEGWLVTFANAAAMRTTGLSRDEFAGSNLRELARKKLPYLDIPALERAMRERETTQFEAASRGQRYHCSAYPLADGGLALYCREVTERERAEAALRQSHEDLKRAQSVGQIGSWRLDVASDVLAWSEETYRIFGKPVGTPLTYEIFLSSVHPDDRGFVGAKWQAAIRGEPYDIEHRLLVEGQVRWVREKAFLEFDEAGELLGGFGIAQDITERKTAEEALRESEARLQIATEATGLGVFDYDVRSGRIEWDERLRAMWGLPPEETVTLETFIGGIHTEDRGRIQASLEAALDPAGPHHFRETYRVIGRDDMRRWVIASGQVLFEGDEAVRIIGTAEDVTLWVETQNALLESEERYRTIVELADEDLSVSADGSYSFEKGVEDAIEGRTRLRTWLAVFTIGARRHRVWVLVAAIAFEFVFLVPMGFPEPQQVRGLPGSVLALTVVIAAVLAGWQIGLAAALAGGAIFWGAVAGFGQRGELGATLLTTGIWVIAALLAGLLTDSLTEQVRLRKSAAVALARAETLREQEAEKAAQEERARLARDLHDSVTQSLFAATLKAEALTLAGDHTSAATSALEDVRRLSRGALAQMRALLLELRGDPVAEVPLRQLLRHLVEATESRASVKVILAIDQQVALRPEVHEAVYRIAQEALNNVVRHARAENAWVQVRAEDGRARLVVGDDGQGFDPVSVGQGHYGLVFMRERAEETGGELMVTSSADEGTAVTVEWHTMREGPTERTKRPSQVRTTPSEHPTDPL